MEPIQPIEPPLHLEVTFGPAVANDKPRTLKVRRVEVFMLTLKDNETVALKTRVLDIKRKPARLDGPPQWQSSDPKIASVIASDDGLSCVIKAEDELGTVRITATADADTGPGVKTLTGIFDVEVVASEAVIMEIEAGTPTPQ